MESIIREKLIEMIECRIVNTTLLAEMICKTAYSGKTDVSVIGASCEVLREYLDNTWDMVRILETGKAEEREQ